MFRLSEKIRQKAIADKVEKLNKEIQGNVLSKSLDKNKAVIGQLFKDNDTLITRDVQNMHDQKLKFTIFFCDGFIDPAIINDNIIRPINICDFSGFKGDIADTIMNQVVQINELKKTDNIAEIIKYVTYGNTILLIEGSKNALILGTKYFKVRAVAEPDSEKILSGPREGFNEVLLSNVSMIQRRIRTNNLKIKFMNIGRQTNTQICVCYINGIAQDSVVQEMMKRLEALDIDAVLDANYLTELIKDNPYSPFRTTGYTERPDVIAGKLLEGRIAVFVDGTPVVLTAPYLFIENFQSPEDYYLSYYYTSFSRLLRIVGFMLTIFVPALYIGMVAFHHELIPSVLIISIASERQSVPLPAAVEAVVILLVFDILRETGIRMPSNIGQALGIVGALVIGQAAVEAKLVAAPMIIVVALTGITNLLIPKMNASVIFLRLGLLLITSVFGFLGLVAGASVILIHIINLKSFGVSVLSMASSFEPQNNKDIFIRAPWNHMLTRPKPLSKNNTRMKVQNGDKND
jgi:spore germination protein KA